MPTKNKTLKNKKTAGKLAEIGKLISRLREDRGITQNQLAEKINTTQSVVARIEKGEQNLSTETLVKIGQALNKEILSLSGALNFKVQGGRTLSGTIAVRTSKNGAVGTLCASLLNKNKTTLKDVPKIEEVYRILEVLQSIGVSVHWIDNESGSGNSNDLEIKPPKEFKMDAINREAAEKTRSCIMLIGPLIHFLDSFKIPQAGGCRLGTRTVAPHFYALEKFGVTITASSNNYEINLNKKSTASHARTAFSNSKPAEPIEIVLYEAGDTLTENVLMAAALHPGTTTIKYASANYQVQDVCFLLQEMGVTIEGIGTTTLIVHGLQEIDKPVTYHLSEDPIEAMSLISAAIVTRSSIVIERCPINFLEIELLKLEKMGLRYEILKRYKSLNGRTDLVDIKTYPSNLRALVDKIDARPYPGLNIDNLPFFAIIATQAEGTTFIHDWVYEERAIYYKELDKLRAQTMLADPHRIYISGPTKLKSAEIICPPALRPSVIILVGMLAAEGTSILRNVYNINRGYEDLAERLNKIGAKIETFRDL